MDLRARKTKKSIKNAFIRLRSKKPLERISIKELAEEAEISKATFYLHYHDIYDLSDSLQKEVISDVLNHITNPQLILTDSAAFTKELFYAFMPYQNLIEILFSGTQACILPTAIEEAIREHLFSLAPGLKEITEFDIMLSYKIQGGYYAYQQHRKQYGIDCIADVIGRMAKLDTENTVSSWTRKDEI